MAKIEQLKKITLGTCETQPSAEMIAKLEKNGGVIPLLDVYGIATRYKPGESNFGPYIAFLGSFRAIRHSDKAAFASGKVLLPKMLEEQLYAVMGSDEVSNVQFAFRIGAKHSKKAATRYEYTAESLTPPSESDPLVMLEKQLTGKLLPAPKA